VNKKTAQRVQDLVQEAAGSHAEKGTIAQKVGDYYASFTDQESIEARKLTPRDGRDIGD
jgi:putative endopeptidase